MSSFIRAVEVFFEQFAAIGWPALMLALVAHLAKIAARVRVWHNILSAAYPDASIHYRRVFGSYVAGLGVNAVVPARGGDLLKLYLIRRRVGGSSYPTLAATLLVETLFDIVIASALVAWAIYLGVLPGLDVLPNLQAFDWAWMVRHPISTGAIAAGVVAVGVLLAVRGARHVVAFKQRVAQGFSILRTPHVYFRRVIPWQLLDWSLRLTTIYFFLRAFDLIPSLHSALLVQVTQSVSGVIPFTPAGIGTEQALLVYVFAGKVSTTSLLSFSVGMNLALIVANVVVGFTAILLMLRTFRWRRLVAIDQGLGAAQKPSPAEAAPGPRPQEIS